MDSTMECMIGSCLTEPFKATETRVRQCYLQFLDSKQYSHELKQGIYLYR
jgi:hypothetical protein